MGLRERRRSQIWGLVLDRLRDPLLLILLFAAGMSALLHDWTNAAIVAGIVLISAGLSLVQEYRAQDAIERLRRRLATKSRVLRGGQPVMIPSDEVVAGDLVLLSAGSLIPGDGRLIDSKDCFVSQAVLTGETFPVEKQPGVVPPSASLTERTNCVFMGTSVRSGTASCVIACTGRQTAYGQISDTLARRPPVTEFERGLRSFGGLLIRVMLLVVLAVLTVNIALGRPTVETLLFAVALAVGLSPELLPAILTVTLSRGAQTLARGGVIVRRLSSIENLGSMDVLCTDKTGTLTAGVIELSGALDTAGQPSRDVLLLAALNAHLQTGLANPLDEAIVASAGKAGVSSEGYEKIDEIPYEFVRKRLSVVVRSAEAPRPRLVTKGAFESVLDVCETMNRGGQIVPLDATVRKELEQRFADWSGQGFRVLGVACRDFDAPRAFTRDDEQGLTFAGFLQFFDPPEPGVTQTLHQLRRLGVELKIITGDNGLVARHVAQAVGLDSQHVLTGAELVSMRDEALWALAPQTTLFVEVDPNQKERIIRALQRRGHVVGYLGDGINDAPALHVADVGISVDTAVDVAKEAADLVLLEHDLEVVVRGINDGRHTFANTLKYIFVTTSANFGNMLSMAAASLFLPFLPLLAKQILLNNFLSDIPSMGIAGDNVDREWERTPHRWDLRLVRRFMITFGLVSSLFDGVTFAALLWLAGESVDLFRTGWWVESLLTEVCILYVLRTHRPLWRSPPGRFLWIASLIVGILAVAIPYLPGASLFGFVPLPPRILTAVLAVTCLYIGVSEATKQILLRWLTNKPIHARTAARMRSADGRPG